MTGLARVLLADASRVTGLGRHVGARRYGRAISIATYHGVSRQRLPVPEWCVLDEQSFCAQMEYLAERFTVVHIEDAARVAETRPDKPVACVTFDDGFAGVHDIAWPILDRLQLPATVYLVTGLIDSAETVWFAELHHAITHTTASSVALGDTVHPLLDGASRATASAALQRDLKRHDADEFDELFVGLLDQLGAAPTDFRTVDHFRILTSDQVRSMAAGGLVRFGAHTEHHRILTRVPAARAKAEIRTSVDSASELCGRATTSFAYPNGGPEDFDDVAVAELRRLGIGYAVTTTSGPNWPWSDPLRLLRYGVGCDDSLGVLAWRMHHVPAKLRAALAALSPGSRETA